MPVEGRGLGSPSDEGWDNTTHPERGPQGTGGGVEAKAPPIEAECLTVTDAAEGWRNAGLDGGMAGLALTSRGLAEGF